MEKEKILKAFEGRWRIKGNMGQINSNSATMSFDEFYDYIKGMCLDFFETGITIGESQIIPVEEQNQVMIRDVERVPDMVSANGGFDSWWNLYDKKRGREKCLAKWEKLTPIEQYLCLLNTPAYVMATPEKQYRKDPLTYLNGKCWNDEIINRNGTNKPTIEQQRREKLADILAG